jgi:hypothetical protein
MQQVPAPVPAKRHAPVASAQERHARDAVRGTAAGAAPAPVRGDALPRKLRNDAGPLDGLRATPCAIGVSLTPPTGLP